MANAAPASTTPDPISQLADAVQEHGQGEDSLTAELAKGNREAVAALSRMAGGLFDLLKGGKSSHDEDEDEEDDEDEDDDDYGDEDDTTAEEDDDDDDDDGPGFRMNKGSQRSLYDGADDEPADATAFLLDMAKAQTNILSELRGLGALVSQLADENAVLRESQLHLGKMVQHLGGVVESGTVEMAKAVRGAQSETVALTKAVGQIPAPAKTPTFAPRPAAPPVPEADETSGFLCNVPTERQQARLLMKAVDARVVTPEASSMFKTLGLFDPDPAKHNTILAAVSAFAATVKEA